MNNYPIELQEILVWFRSKDQALKDLGITLADVRESNTAKPAAAANFDTAPAVGQIVAWVSGEIDFQVTRVSDGKDVFLRHEVVSNLSAPSLQSAYDDFLRNMIHPDEGEEGHASHGD
jgi:hypothetical protein